jgi:protein-tyrosine phosphatase
VAVVPTRTAGEQRIVVLEGCCNFRDIGGYPAAQGRRVRWRKLYRADGLHRLTETDVQTLTALGRLTVLDLRTAQEVDERGRVSEGVTVAYHHLPLVDVLPEREDLIVWVDAETIASRYREMLDTGTDAVCEALAILTDPSAYPAVVHCAAGKDRTGILIALILGLIGVPDSHIAADYALSGPAMEVMLVRLREQYPDAQEALERYSPALMAAEPATILRFLDGLRADYGSLDGYAEHLGMGRAIAHLRSALL